MPGRVVDMYERQQEAGSFYRFGHLAGLPGLVHGITADGLNYGLQTGETAVAVENRRQAVGKLGVSLENMVFAQQTHGNRSVLAKPADRGRGSIDYETAIPDTDALIVNGPGMGVVILTADCLPIILYDPVAGVAAVVHAGWKGSLAAIAQRTVERMQERCHSDPANILAGIGPAICAGHYEVGEDIVAQVSSAFPAFRHVLKGRHLDLAELNRCQLVGSGLRPEAVRVAGICTFEQSERFFSHRRHRPLGRFMTVAALR